MSIVTRNLVWGIRGHRIVDDVSLVAPKGQVTGLIGPNGSGKSSLLRLICRLRRASNGTVQLGGRDIGNMPRIEIARRVALVEQQATTDAEVTVRDVIRLGRTPHRGALTPWSSVDELAVTDALRIVDMSDREAQSWRTLSGGERQRVHIGKALAQNPQELLLDEPTNHLDVHHQLEILSLLRGLGVTCLVALHDLNLAAMFCDHVVVLRHGRVVCAGAPDVVLTKPNVDAVFQVASHVDRSTYHGKHLVQYMPPEAPQVKSAIS